MRYFSVISVVVSTFVLVGCGDSPGGTDGVQRVEHGNLVIEGIPSVPPMFDERLRQYQNTRSARFVDWDPLGNGMLIATRFAEMTQLHHVAQPMGARRQVTFDSEPVTNAVLAPAGAPHDGFLFTKDAGGDENYQIYFFDRASGGARLLTDGTSRNESSVWTRAGDRFAFRSNRRNATDWDIWQLRPTGGTLKMLFEGVGAGYWFPAEFSPDDARLAIVHYVSVTDTTLAVLDLEKGSLTEIRANEAPAFYSPVGFSADGGSFYFVSDADGEFRTLHLYNFATGKTTNLTGDIAHDVEEAALSGDGALLAFVLNEGGTSTLHIRTTADWRAIPVPTPQAGIIDDITFSPEGRALAFTLDRATAPADVFVYDLVRRAVAQWTASEVGGLDPGGFVAPRLVSFESFDGLEVPAFVFEPKTPGPHPVLIWIHGGPEAQYRPAFSPFIQYLVREMEIAVIAPNVRGSLGYGKTYVGLDNGRKREDSVRDIGALLDWITTEPSLDESCVIVHGGSYGGYMVLASMVHFSDRLSGGIEYDGVSNFVTSLENTAAYRKSLRRPEYGDERDPEMRAFLESISPLNHIAKFTKPIFVIQGLNDAQVPVGQSERLVAKLRENGNEVWYLLAKDEGHGFRRKANSDYQMVASLQFLDRVLTECGEFR